MQIFFKNGLVIGDGSADSSPFKEDILVREGRIEKIGSEITLSESEDTRTIDLSGKLVIPGLVNAHSHSYANLVKGMGEGLPLEPWMYYAMLVGRMTLDQLRVAASLQVIENIRNGCTSFVDHIARDFEGMDAVMEIYARSGVRAAMAPMIGDLGYTETLPALKDGGRKRSSGAATRNLGDILDECEDLVTKWHGHGGRLSVMIGPSGPQRCSDELLLGSFELSEKYGLGLHTHLLETRIQAQTAENFWGKPMVEHLEELGVLSPRVSLAHAVWLKEKEMEILSDRGVSVVHNPMSNLTIGSGVMPLSKFIDLGINVALGSDGSNCAGSQSIFKSMQLAAVLPRIMDPDYHKWPSSDSVFRMATTGGAIAMGVGTEIGSIEEGKSADLVIIDLHRTTYQPLQDLTTQFVFGETGQGVEMVMIAGRIVLEEGLLTTIDEHAVLNEAKEMSSSLASLRDEWIDSNKENFQYVEKVYRQHWGLEI